VLRGELGQLLTKAKISQNTAFVFKKTSCKWRD